MEEQLRPAVSFEGWRDARSGEEWYLFPRSGFQGISIPEDYPAVLRCSVFPQLARRGAVYLRLDDQGRPRFGGLDEQRWWKERDERFREEVQGEWRGCGAEDLALLLAWGRWRESAPLVIGSDNASSDAAARRLAATLGEGTGIWWWWPSFCGAGDRYLVVEAGGAGMGILHVRTPDVRFGNAEETMAVFRRDLARDAPTAMRRVWSQRLAERTLAELAAMIRAAVADAIMVG